MDEITILLIITVIVLFLLFKGVVKTFKRNAVVAILCVIFLFPIYLIWAFVELFTGRIDKE
jgi:hypothetical protein